MSKKTMSKKTEIAVRVNDAPPHIAAADLIERLANIPNLNVENMERLIALHERGLNRVSEEAFNRAMSLAQAQIVRVAPDANNPATHSKYASYGAIDRIVRPIYTDEGFGLSFDTAESPAANCIRVLCYVTHRDGGSRTYKIDMPADGKGARGNDVMTLTHATGAAVTYGMRYLLKMIFNVAIGQDDTDGNMPPKPKGGQFHREPFKKPVPAPQGEPDTFDVSGFDDGPDREPQRPQEAPRQPSTPVQNPGERISMPQLKRLHTIGTNSGRSGEVIKAWLFSVYGYKSSKEITRGHYEAITKAIESKEPLPVKR